HFAASPLGADERGPNAAQPAAHPHADHRLDPRGLSPTRHEPPRWHALGRAALLRRAGERNGTAAPRLRRPLGHARDVHQARFDALIHYVSALGQPGGDTFKRYWPHVEHLIGKDILKPHAIYWPCMLKAVGLDVFRHLDVHGYWNIGGGKMSKSIGNVVEALAL